MNPRKRLMRRLDKVEDALAGRGGAAERVHEARRQLKKARALLALGRCALGRGRADRAETELVEAGRALSNVRDAEVAARAFAGLKTAPRGPEAALKARRKAAESTLDAASAAAKKRVESARGELGRMGRPRRRALGRAARRALETVVSLGEAALLAPDDEALHDWRKSAKRLDGMLAEADAPTPRLKRLRERLSELGDALGDDHDLVILRGALGRGGGCPPAEAEASRRRALLLEKAAKVAPDLSRLPPRRLAKEFRRSLAGILGVVLALSAAACGTSRGGRIAADEPPLRLAMMPLANKTGDRSLKDAGEALSERISKQLSGNPRIAVVERARLIAAVEELALTEQIDAHTAARVGRLLEADYLVFGALTQLGPRPAISLRIMNVETREIVGSPLIDTSGAPDFERASGAAAQDLILTIKRHGAARTTAL